MIGTVMQAAGDPPQGEITCKLRDALLAMPGRPAKRLDPTDLWFKASDAHVLCPRLYALALLHDVPIKEGVGPDLLWTFGVGTGFHHALQNELLPGLGAVLQGCWERVRKDGTYERVEPSGAPQGPWVERGWRPRPEGEFWRFVEPKGRIPAARFVGMWDGVLVWPDSATEVLEVKSIREDLFATVNPLAGGRPKADHVLQCQAYMWMSGLTRARLVYVAKGSAELRNVMCEHLIVRDEVAIKGLEAQLIACAAGVKGMEAAVAVLRRERPEGMDDATWLAAREAAMLAAVAVLPERPAVCRIKSDARARKCDLRDLCFPPKPKKEKPVA